jgi:hypothetical protein
MKKIMLSVLFILLLALLSFRFLPLMGSKKDSTNTLSDLTINTMASESNNVEIDGWIYTPTIDKPDTTNSVTSNVQKWIGYIQKNKIYFRGSGKIHFSEIPKKSLTSEEYTNLWNQTTLQNGDTVWVCLPYGKYLKAVVDSLFYYICEEGDANYLMFTARSAQDITNEQYLSTLIFNKPPYKSAYSILPEQSSNTIDSLLMRKMVSELYPRMSIAWIESFQANLDEESKKQYPSTYKFTFTNICNMYKFMSSSTSDAYTVVDIRWNMHASNPSDFGIIELGKNEIKGYTKLWTNEWYSKPEEAMNNVSVKSLYYDNLGNIALLVACGGYEWAWHEILLFDLKTNAFVTDSSYIDL